MYHSPNHLSENARDLISRILVVDPIKRMSVPEICDHPWLKNRLPFPNRSVFSRQENVSRILKTVPMILDLHLKLMNL